MSDEANSNVNFFVPAKKLERHYRQQKYTVTYIPATKKWKWEVIFVRTTKFADEAKTMNAAFKAAEKHIDDTLKLRGK